jgi:hypothetical protein
LADHVITIAMQVNTFGPAPSTKWGVGSSYTMTWGASKWGEGTEKITVDFEKVLVETQALADAIVKEVEKVIAATINPSYANTVDNLSQGVWNYGFPGNTSNAVSGIATNYSSGTAGSTTWTSNTAGGTSWS